MTKAHHSGNEDDSENIDDKDKNVLLCTTLLNSSDLGCQRTGYFCI